MTFQPPISSPNYQALYIHIPFCARRCSYCDFTSEACDFADPQIDSYLTELITKVQDAAERGLLRDVSTVYIGGGTPSFLGAKRLQDLLQPVNELLDTSRIEEFTVEANPDSLDQEVIEVLAVNHVNRLSIGVQSFADNEEDAIGRLHDGRRAIQAIKDAKVAFENISIDIMCGIPKQTMASLKTTLDTAIELDIQHISVYPLTLEEGSALTEEVNAGHVTVPDDDTSADMLILTAETLLANGFDHYEIASYSRPGFQSRHNIAYWTAKPYLGIGRGAVGMCMQGQIRMRYSDSGIIEEMDIFEQAAEDLMLRLRLMEGAPAELIEKTDRLLPNTWQRVNELIEYELLEHTDKNVKLTPYSWLLANEVFGRIWGLVE